MTNEEYKKLSIDGFTKVAEKEVGAEIHWECRETIL